ncbi:hypothetical protein L1887_18999 [Cichorium endivia]|nr:hypothetical protein L1887_18999 [Cichorium endivia]
MTASTFTTVTLFLRNLPLSPFLSLSKTMLLLVLCMILGWLIRKLVMNQNTSQLGYLSVHNDVEASEMTVQQEEVLDIDFEITVQQLTVHNDVSETIQQQQEVFYIESQLIVQETRSDQMEMERECRRNSIKTTTAIIVSTIVPMLTPCEDVNSQGDSVLEGIFFGFDIIAFLLAGITVTLRASFIHYRERSMMKFLSIMDKVMMVSELLAMGAWVTGRSYM